MYKSKIRTPTYITTDAIIAEGKDADGKWKFMQRTRGATLYETWGEKSLDKTLYYVADNAAIGWRIEK